ncbi:MAG: hypothetical protein ACI93N_000042 [Flavobacteriaceae bacterium]|jgi:hypothetical protein
MKIFKYWVLSISLIPIFVLFGSNLGLGSISQLYVFAVIIFPFFRYNLTKGVLYFNNKFIFFTIILFLLILLNIALSINPVYSFSYWLVYILFVYGFHSWVKFLIRNNKYSELLFFLNNRIGFYMVFSLLLMYVGIFILKLGNAKTMNAFGIVNGSVLAYFWFYKFKNSFYKVLVILILTYTLFISLSRSSLIFSFLAIIVIELLSFKKNLKRNLFFVTGILIIFVNSVQFILNWVNQKQFRPGTDITDLAGLLVLNNDRFMLIENFFKVFKNNFFTGYGIESNYYMLSEWDAASNIGVHNGVLDMILTLGVPLSILFLSFFYISLKKIFNISKTSHHYRAVMCFVIYCLIRSYGETYFLINIGNIMSIIFLMILITFFNFKNISND